MLRPRPEAPPKVDPPLPSTFPDTGLATCRRTERSAAPVLSWWTTAASPSTKPADCGLSPTPYSVRAIGNTLVWEERDPKLRTLIAIHWYSQTFEGHRVFWMDDRPHPPAYAPHSYMGFSTGTFVGNALRVETTHLKQGWFRRNGLPESDQATLTEFFVRHGDHITYTSVVNDPVFLSEPWIRTTDFYRQPTDPGAWLFPCDDSEQIVGRAPDQVPNYLFGAHPYLDEYSKKNHVPLIGALGGPETLYREFESKLASVSDAQARELTRPAPGPSATSVSECCAVL